MSPGTGQTIPSCLALKYFDHVLSPLPGPMNRLLKRQCSCHDNNIGE